MVGQQRLVDNGGAHALAGDALRLQAAHPQPGVLIFLQKCGGLILGPGKRSAGVVGIGVQVRGVVFVWLIGLLGIVIQPGQIAQVAVRRSRFGGRVGISAGVGSGTAVGAAAGAADSAVPQAVSHSASRQSGSIAVRFMV